MAKPLRTTGRFALAAVTLIGIASGTSIPVHAGQDQAAPPQPRQILMTGAEDSRPTTAREIAGLQELTRMIDRSPEGLQVVQRPDGGWTVDLQGRFMSLAVATPQASGTAPVACMVGADALAALKAAAKPSGATAPVDPLAVARPARKVAPSQLEEKE